MILLALVAAAAMIAGCGEDEGAGAPSPVSELPDPGGSLRIAVPGTIATLDPLLAGSRAERLASRQVHEPLASRQAGPFGQTRQRPGLARSFQSSEGDTIWTATLRGGVRFQNGELLDQSAVLANVDRWLSTSVGTELLPELVERDAPEPEVVRFFLDRPVPRFPQRLADARLGLIAPAALASAGLDPIAISALRTGTGPFELREHQPDRTLLARNASWWGTPLGLGPGVDQIELIGVPDGLARVEQLASGSVEVAAALDPDLVRTVLANPLLAVVRGGGSALGMERSVRGIESADADQALADVWLTDLP